MVVSLEYSDPFEPTIKELMMVLLIEDIVMG